MLNSVWSERYEVGPVIGTGAFSTVYRGHDRRLDLDVALKVLADNHTFDPDIRERFLNEARLLGRIRSPHVVRVVDLGETDRRQPFLVMELADRGTLADRVAHARERRWQPGPSELAAVTAMVAGALTAMHEQRIVHRDLTPRNVLIASAPGGGLPPSLFGPDERLVLADLGLSKDLAAASGLTAGVGTGGFTPPEQRDGGEVDIRADVWAASALVAWLATGVPGGDPTWRPRLAGAEQPGAAALLTALDRGLAADPKARHVDAARWRDEVLAALTSLPRPVPPGARAGHDPGNDPGPAGPPAGRRRRVLAGVGVALVVGAVGGLAIGVAVDRRDEEPGTTTTELDGGRLRVTATGPGPDVTVEGPGTATVGETARFTAAVDDDAAFVWISPEGAILDGAPAIEVELTGAGVTEVGLLAVDDTGRRSVVELELRVEDP